MSHPSSGVYTPSEQKMRGRLAPKYLITAPLPHSMIVFACLRTSVALGPWATCQPHTSLTTNVLPQPCEEPRCWAVNYIIFLPRCSTNTYGGSLVARDLESTAINWFQNIPCHQIEGRWTRPSCMPDPLADHWRVQKTKLCPMIHTSQGT